MKGKSGKPFQSRDRDTFVFKKNRVFQNPNSPKFQSRDRDTFVFKFLISEGITSYNVSFNLAIEILLFSRIYKTPAPPDIRDTFQSRDRDTFVFKQLVLAIDEGHER